MDYDEKLDRFLGLEYLRKYPQEKIDSFHLAMSNFYSTVNNEYFNAYINYTIAALKQNTMASEKKLFESFLHNKPILYQHPEYMNFFNAFYKQKLQKISMSKQGSDLSFLINNRGSFSATIASLKKDPFIQNNTI